MVDLKNSDEMSAPAARRNSILAYFVRHATAANLLLVLLLIAGLAAVTKIRAQYFPDVAVESVRVTINWKGVGPKEIDEAIAKRVEPKLRTVPGVQFSYSRTRQGSARFYIEFQPAWDMSKALDDVRAALDDVRDLPSDADPPVLRRTRWFDRVTNVIISGPVGIDLLNQYLEEFRTQLLQVGVTSTQVRGISDPEVRIEIRPEVLERYKLTLSAVAAAVRAETGTKPVGEIDRGVARVRTQAREVSAQSLGDVAIRSRPDGTKLRLRDIATLIDFGLDKKEALYHKGQPAIMLRVNRDAQGDAIRLHQKVKAVAKKMQATMPKGVEIVLSASRAEDISNRLGLLIKNGLTGLIIVVVLLFLFLSGRTAIWVAAGIPVAMAATIAMMHLFGVTLNMISLFALIICLGIIVDDAIVVGEHADHLSRNGYSPSDAATLAAQRMWAPVFAASVTTVIAFSVLVLIQGRFGKMLSDFPFTVGVVIAASLFEAFIILPAHMRYSLSAGRREDWFDAPSRFINRHFSRFRDTTFKSCIRFLIAFRYPVVAAILVLLSVTVSALLDRTVGWRFFSGPERSMVRANLAMYESAKRSDTRAMLNELDRALSVTNRRFKKKYGRAPVKIAIAKLGGTSGRRGLKSAEVKVPDLIASYEIELIDGDLRPYSVKEFARAWKREIKRAPLLEVLTLRGGRSGPSGEDIDVYLLGGSEAQLKIAAEALKQELRRFSAVGALEDSLPYDKPELVLKLTPKGEALGFTTDRIAKLLRERLYGIEAVKLAQGTREIVVRVRLPDQSVGPNYLRQAKLPVEGGGFVPLMEIASVKQKFGFSVIRRENGKRYVNVEGDLHADGAAGDAVIRALRDRILPSMAAKFGVEWQLLGRAKQESRFIAEAQTGFLLALSGIYLTLVWIFGSWVRPVVIMLVIPFGLIGTVWGHYLHGIPLSMFSIVGLIGMAGIIINDSIVLVTTIDQRAKYQDMLTAVMEGSADRLRAVLLTTLTTVGGLMPLLFETSRQALFLKPTVITLAYGLGFGMVLVLVLTPALIAIEHDIRMQINSFRRMVRLRRRQKARASKIAAE